MKQIYTYFMETENFRAHFQQQPDGWINYDSFVRGK